MLNRQALIVAVSGVCLLSAGAIALAQEISVTPVSTAPAYAQPLKVDTDRYAAQQRARERRALRDSQSSSPVGVRDAARQPTQRELQAVMRQLTPEYNRRLKRDGEDAANVWIRQAAFEMGQQAAQARGGTR